VVKIWGFNCFFSSTRKRNPSTYEKTIRSHKEKGKALGEKKGKGTGLFGLKLQHAPIRKGQKKMHRKTGLNQQKKKED